MQNAGPEGEPIPGSLATRLWSALLGKADVVLNGHDHSYQRFKPVSGVTEIVDGTLGHSRQAPGPTRGSSSSSATSSVPCGRS